jgi:hypothetical protein
MVESLLHFVETPIFTKRIDKLTSIETLFDLQNELSRNPKLQKKEIGLLSKEIKREYGEKEDG